MPNYYAMVHTGDRKLVVEAFQRAETWNVRKSAWDEYEAQSSIGELEIQSESPVLINGSIVPNGFEQINEIVGSTEFRWTAELYDDDGNCSKRVGSEPT